MASISSSYEIQTRAAGPRAAWRQVLTLRARPFAGRSPSPTCHSHLVFLKGWKWQKNVAMGTGHQHVKRLGVLESLRWCGKSASCGRGKANLFVLFGFEQGFGGQWLVPFPFGTDICPRRRILGAGRGSQGGRRLWWITAEFWSWLVSKNFCQLMGCTAFILLKESTHIWGEDWHYSQLCRMLWFATDLSHGDGQWTPPHSDASAG